jgi:type VI secretion system protein ImpK
LEFPLSPRFAQAVDPVFTHVLGLLDRVAADERPSPQEERLRIVALLDQAEAIIGAGTEWELAKYALVSWIDEMLVETPWDGREWWSNNVLEVDLFNTRLCNEQFYVSAQEASSLARRDALEVYYVCVVLGFRGLYRDPQMAAMFGAAHGLPADLDTWAKQTSLAIRLGQGRPMLAGPRRDVAGAPPLRTKPLLAWSWLAAVLLGAAAIVYYGMFLAGS